MFQRIRSTLPLIACLIAVPLTAAAAESVGEEGNVIELEVNQNTADKYLQYHGRVVIGDKQSVSEYRWGGTSCGSRILSEHQVSLLARALETGLSVQPRHQPGQGSAQCLVGFTLVQ